MMFLRTKPLFLIITLVAIAGCVEDEEKDSILSKAPDCPATDMEKDYVGCWNAQDCSFLDMNGEGQSHWRRSTYYLTSDGKFFDYISAYDNPSCGLEGVLVDLPSTGVRSELSFEDLGREVLPSSGREGHRLLFKFAENSEYEVISEVNPDTGEICFSNNLEVKSNSLIVLNQNGVEIDYSNCLNSGEDFSIRF